MTNTSALAIDRSAPQKATPRTVLIVEDNEINMKLFDALLQAKGFNVLKARDGTQGVELARQHRPDLIIMDVQLPGMSGLDAAKLIKDDSALKTIPIVAVTAFAMKGDEERIRDAGCDDYIAKPITPIDFLKTIESHING
jgi:two-component system cell cycle response regulator DivK